jgi:hypothetical protein
MEGSPDTLLEGPVVPLGLRHVIACGGIIHDDVKFVVYNIHLVLEFLITVNRCDIEACSVVATKDHVQGTKELLGIPILQAYNGSVLD